MWRWLKKSTPLKNPKTKKNPLPARPVAYARPGPKLELLAPAGSPASWAAALEAGADAVYLGLKEFSARAFAKNFSLSELAGLVPLTHEQGARVLVAFNALLKENELAQAARLLDALTRIKPDGLIIQDLGLLSLIKKHFPQFEIHASTLMAGHNAPGLTALAELGFDRAVLARELTLSDIEGLAVDAPLGLEIFIHGAMCFSFSGLCLMSSFLGGKGSLRGACTQPCRRRYASGKKKGYFFSPTDLDASELMARIRDLPLAALKIEGRMKGPDYVSRVVRAYRLLLDAPAEDMEAALSESRELLASSLGRHRSTGFFLSAHPQAGLSPGQAAVSGLFLGRVNKPGPDGGLVNLQEALEVGDRLRVQLKRNDERRAFTLKRMNIGDRRADRAVAGDDVYLAAPLALSAGDLVFKVDKAGKEKEALASPLAQAFKARPLVDIKPSPRLKGVLNKLRARPNSKPGQGRSPETWYRVSRVGDVSGLAPIRPQKIILPITRANVKRMAGLRRKLGPLFSKLIWTMPPLLFEPDLPAFRQDLARLGKMGTREFMISNLGHLPLLRASNPSARGRKIRVFADHRLNCLNTQAEAELADLGLAGVTLCLENDEENLARILGRPGPIPRLLYLYGRPPLFTSRFIPAGLKDNLPLESPRRERFRLRPDQYSVQVFAERPVFLAPLLRFKAMAGVKAFIVDLEFDPRPLATAREVNEAIKKRRPIKNTSRFNLKRGLF